MVGAHEHPRPDGNRVPGHRRLEFPVKWMTMIELERRCLRTTAKGSAVHGGRDGFRVSQIRPRDGSAAICRACRGSPVVSSSWVVASDPIRRRVLLVGGLDDLYAEGIRGLNEQNCETRDERGSG
ncbi:TonB-linked outer membrane protein [Striga asiatica]|uniref:TonB-linked outer membrane protein n=1 Tax=Striga asiatica TaxID=4170 RepID=A0A5A7Q8L7_STRAF|nr:TonB-linked outer membrane protein [Striga asiatica]